MSNDLKKLSDKLERILKLRTTPIGVTLLPDKALIPKGVLTPESCTVCQVTGIARYHNVAVCGEKGKVKCPMGSAALGFSEWPPTFFEKRIGEYSDDLKVIKKMMLEAPQIAPNTFAAMLAAPISKMDVVPDVISVYANPAQILLIAYGVSWKEGNELVCKTTGHMGECSNTIAATFLHKIPTLALPCYGARRRGLCAEDEMIVGIPPQWLNRIMEGIEKACECGRIYPAKIHGLIGYYSPHWPDKFESWDGMDVL